MKKILKKVIMVLMASVVCVTGCASNAPTGTAAEPENVALAVTAKKATVTKANCTIGFAEKYIAETLGIEQNGPGYAGYRTALVDAGVIPEGMLTDMEKNLNLQELALLISGMLDYREEKEDEKLKDSILEQNRISNLDKIKDEYKDAVVRAFGAGILVGESNGEYSQNRKFPASSSVTKTSMKAAVMRVTGEKARFVLSPDGQLTRKTNLPKKYKRFKYILASFPNEFYDLKMDMDRITYEREPVYMEAYTYPKDIMKMTWENWDGDTVKFSKQYATYGDMWYQKVYDNLNYRLNFDYRTVDDEWINGLAKTYWNTIDKNQLKDVKQRIRAYVKKAKKNHVVVEADRIVIEPSAIYDCGGSWYRCYVRFKVTADEIYSKESERQDELIFRISSDYHWLNDLKNGKYHEGVYDINIASTFINDPGYGRHVWFDGLWEYDNGSF